MNYQKTDWDSVQKTISTTNWNLNFNNISIDKAVKMWTDTYKSIIELYTPTKTVKVQPWSNAWYNKAVSDSRRKRDKESWKLRKCHLPKSHPKWNKLERLREERSKTSKRETIKPTNCHGKCRRFWGQNLVQTD